jgi:predicted nucleic acid-binding protein
VIRLAINPSVVTAPARLDDVLGFCHALREDDSATVLGHRPTAWAIFTQYCMLPHTSANTIPDAFLAACSRDAGLTLATFDRGFVRFPRLRWMQARTGQVFTNPR